MQFHCEERRITFSDLRCVEIIGMERDFAFVVNALLGQLSTDQMEEKIIGLLREAT